MRKFLIFFFFALISAKNYAFSGQGSGTEKDPYWVTNADELFEVRNELGAYYMQTCDIDLTMWIKENNPTQGWAPINDFSGSYDGGHYIIKGLMINRPSTKDVGLFGNLLYEANVTLKNINLINPNIIGKDCVGGIVGFAIGRNKYINNNTIAGGYISSQEGLAGGIVGYAYHGPIYITGNFVSCQIKGRIIGGICGQAEGYSDNYQTFYVEIYDNLFNGKLEAIEYAGGIIGQIPDYGVNVFRNIAGGNIFSNATACGIVYRNHANTVTNNISTAENISGMVSCYKICNNNDGNTSNNYACTSTKVLINGKVVDVEDNACNGIGIGKKTLMKQTTYEGYGFDFNSQWKIEEGETYPYNIYQANRPIALSFKSGSKAVISGTSTASIGKVYAIVNETVFETIVIDGKWEMNVGNVSFGTQAQIMMSSEGKSLSLPVKIVATQDTITPEVNSGDSNGDGTVDAVDVVSIINYILGKPSSSFKANNADTNGDGQILVDDAVGTVNIIMNEQ